MILAKFTISGHSMKPTFAENDIVLASSVPYWFVNPKIGDVVVFGKRNSSTSHGIIFVKRIAEIQPFDSSQGKKYFVIGDNKNDSFDSRKFGWIEKDQIMGKVIKKL